MDNKLSALVGNLLLLSDRAHFFLGKLSEFPSIRALLAAYLYPRDDNTGTYTSRAAEAFYRADAILKADARKGKDAEIPGDWLVLTARIKELEAALMDAVETQQKTVPPLYAAVKYILDRQQEDPDLRYQMGPGMEAFRLLCVAEAAYIGRPFDEVEKGRVNDRQLPHRARKPDILIMRDYLAATDPDWRSKVSK